MLLVFLPLVPLIIVIKEGPPSPCEAALFVFTSLFNCFRHSCACSQPTDSSIDFKHDCACVGYVGFNFCFDVVNPHGQTVPCWSCNGRAIFNGEAC